jgi:hypothetical protein
MVLVSPLAVAAMASFVLIEHATCFVPQVRTYARSPTASLTLSATTSDEPRTLYDKIWDDHVVDDDGVSSLLYIDRHLVHEVTSPQAFEGKSVRGRFVVRCMFREML